MGIEPCGPRTGSRNIALRKYVYTHREKEAKRIRIRIKYIYIFIERLKGNWRAYESSRFYLSLVFILNENFVYNLSQKLKEDQFHHQYKLKREIKKKKRKKKKCRELIVSRNAIIIRAREISTIFNY